MNPDNFWQNLRGKDAKAQGALDALREETRRDTRILWYPSAGLDFRDLLETHPGRLAENHWEDPANVHVHTDYDLHTQCFQNPVLYQDRRTRVRCLDRFELEWLAPWNYVVSPDLAHFLNHASPVPRISLFHLEITSHRLGQFTRPRIYFFAENINFLEEILMKHQIPVYHLVKIRDGSGFGGGAQRMDVLYPFLHRLGTRYLTRDDHNFHPNAWCRRFLARHRIPSHGLEAGPLPAPDERWSDLRYRSFEIKQHRILTPENLELDFWPRRGFRSPMQLEFGGDFWD